MKYVNAQESVQIDVDLAQEYGFVDDIVLMELAGLSSASAIYDAYPADTHRNALLIIGPGKNGGDGLVCARHMALFGYHVTICYPRYKDQAPFNSLRPQCQNMGIPIMTELPENFDDTYDIIVDAIFGYSFKGPIREPFNSILNALKTSKKPIASLDIPSGWDVELGNTDNGIEPEFLISLSVPKMGSRDFKGRYHYLGGRFIPAPMDQKYGLNLPRYPGSQQFILLN